MVFVVPSFTSKQAGMEEVEGGGSADDGCAGWINGRMDEMLSLALSL